MEHRKIYKLLKSSTVLKFLIRKWIKANNLWIDQYFTNKSLKFQSTLLKSDFYDFSDTFTVVKWAVNTKTVQSNDIPEKEVSLKIKTPFRSRITKTNGRLVDNAENLHIMKLIYNLL